MTTTRYTAEVPAVLHAEGMLLCPVCGPDGFGYLHHGAVKVYARDEDAERVVVGTIDGITAQTAIERDSGANPSARRGGIVIQFWCETCGATDLELMLAQHKGQTFMSWRRPAGGDRPA